MTEKESRYRQMCHEELQLMLKSDFMHCDPTEEDDANLIIGADLRSRRWTFEGKSFCSHINQFCSLLSVDGLDTALYAQPGDNTAYVEELVMHPYNCKSNERIRTALNQFQYPMMLDKGLKHPFDESLAKFACCMDERHDEEYILTREGQMFFYSYYLGGITRFNQQRRCYRLFSMRPDMIPDLLRREILKAQAVAVQYVFRYPEFCRPIIPDSYLTHQKEGLIMKEVAQEYASDIIELSKQIKARVNIANVKVEHI